MKRSGMSLLEILIVLSIMAVLIALVAPRILGSQKKSEIKAANMGIFGIKKGLDSYYVDNRTFPSTEEGLAALYEAPSDEKRAKKWDGPYMEGSLEKMVDPWGNEYKYEYPSTHGSEDFPDIWSVGPDGEDNTDDDVANFSIDSDESGSNSNSDSGSSKKSSGKSGSKSGSSSDE
jgi:general secretion pathway protein G